MTELEKNIAQNIMKAINSGDSELSAKHDDMDAYVDLFSAERSEKDYEWMSDIFIPEFPTQINTQLSIDVDQYFKTRDFVGVYLQDKKGILPAASAQECINRTLNRRDLYHYPKFCRAKLFTYLGGGSYARCWWDKKVRQEEVQREIEVPVEAEDGTMTIERDTIIDTVKVIERDEFNYEILDTRQVIVSGEFAYSPQTKKWLAIWSNKTYDELLEEAEDLGYNNEGLEELKEKIQPTAKVKNLIAQNRRDNYNETIEHLKDFVKYEWYGKHYMVITERDDFGYPLAGTIGIDDEGNKKPSAELVEVIAVIANNSQGSVLLRFDVTPYFDSLGRSYRPLLRSTCYFHPTDDEGIGDGLYSRDLQIALNDSYNLGADRMQMATVPTLLTKRYVDESDEIDLYIAPGHHIPVTNPQTDVVELEIKENAGAALSHVAFLSGKMQQSSAVNPPAYAGVGQSASTSATSTADTANKGDIRANYKAMNFEYTWLIDMYWMIQNMTWAFAEEETALQLMGEDKLNNFNPSLNYFYKPVSQTIESESSKGAKIKDQMTMLGYIVNMQHPDTPKLVNKILDKVGKLMGDETDDIMQLDESKEVQPTGQQKRTSEPVSNQQGLPITDAEASVRS